MQSCETAIQAFDKYIWALAHRFARGMRGVDPEDLHQEGLITLYEIYTSSVHSHLSDDERDALVNKSIVNRFIDIKRHQFLQDQQFAVIDLDVASQFYGEDAFGELNLQYCQEYLAHFVSVDAAKVLDLLIQPSPELVWEFQLQTMRRAHIQRQGLPTQVTTRIPHWLVGKVLGFGESKTKNLIRELRQAFREHMCSTLNYKLNAVMC